MKKVGLAAGVLVLSLTGIFCEAATAPVDGNYEKISEEAEKNRELLEIWKDHVRTLTKERDAAYKELEVLKAKPGSAGNIARFGGIETQAMPVGTLSMTSNMRDLQTQIKTLQTRAERAEKELSKVRSDAAAGEASSGDLAAQKDEAERQARELKYQNDALQARLEKMKTVEKELADTRAYLTPIIKDLESENGQLKAQNKSLSDSVKKYGNFDQIQTDNQSLRSDLQDASKESERLRSENERLASQIDAARAKSDALESAKHTQDQNLKETTEELAKLEEENRRIKSAQASFMKSSADNENMKRSYDALQESFKQQNEKVTVLLSRDEDFRDQIASLQSKLQAALADSEKAKASEANLDRVLAENESLRKAVKSAEDRFQSQEAQLRDFSSQVTELKQANASIKNDQADQIKTIEDLRAALKANLADMQNLKTNFESYLESLVASFDDRQKRRAVPESSVV